MVEITAQSIDIQQLLSKVGSPQAGAVVLFLGTARAYTDSRQTASLDYECYPDMARSKLAQLEAEARKRWPIIECSIVHRIGHLEVGEASVAVAVSTPHRKAAFEAGQWLIDTLKEVVPIWKKENWASGDSEWVHPGLTIHEGISQHARASPTGSCIELTLHLMSQPEPLIDSFGRVHTNLRISVTDRCNIRCFYCMPAENVPFKPRHELLTFEEIERIVRVVALMGVRKIRLTGGEPLVRQELAALVKKIASVPGIRDIALTTNGILLAEQAQSLKDAGLNRLNISLDSLSRETFFKISRREGLDRVLDGIFTARRVGFKRIRLNAVAIRGITEVEIIPLGEFAREHGMELRFIEFMPLDADGSWDAEQVLTGEHIRAVLEDAFGPLETRAVEDPSQPATDYQFADGVGQIGFINPVSQPFCARCNRLRLTADGQVRNCLFSTEEWDARAVMRGVVTDEELAQLIRASVGAKRAGHGINSDQFLKPERAMYQIGG